MGGEGARSPGARPHSGSKDLIVEKDLTVRTNSGYVVQFKYGDDGIDLAKSDHGSAVDLVR